MAKIFISFEAASSDELTELILSYALHNKKPPSWVGAPLDAEALQAEAEARERIDAEDEAAAKGNGEDPEPAPPEPEPPAKRTRAPRAPRVSAVPTSVPSVTPLPAELPPLDTLKAAVTSAVRLAQKGEGSRAILDLLPAFKDATGLSFVMNSEDKHRGALYDLVQAAGLEVI